MDELQDVPLFKQTLAAIAESAASCNGLLSSSLKDGAAATPDGISLLSLKNSLMLAYMHNLVLLTLARLHGRSLDSDDRVRSSLVEQLVRQRVILEKIKPLETKLRYQIDKLVSRADAADRQEAENGGSGIRDEEIANDPLAFKPNPAALAGQDDPDAGSDEDGGVKGVAGPSDGIYRPPRLAPVAYNEDTRGKKVRKPAPNALVRDMATSLVQSASNPYMESTSGLSITPALQSRKAAKLAEITRYEEENMTRLFMTKKDSKRRRMDEEEIALGGTGTREDLMAGSKGVRGRRAPGIESEFDDILGSIAKRKKTGQADGYDQLRALKREKRAPGRAVDAELVHTNGLPGGSEVTPHGKGKFNNAVRKEQARQKKKGRNTGQSIPRRS